ncbi:hypothetical protein [Legionella spiritensis]|uniref:hypothetical protein n=1 Tax=Legionella spiritensis TaxID=452 RepID=UPI000F71A3A3|nr:hypothetical protein [Legionella spiritensis]VEG91752.1 Uncharacterised protein [Legionella spiritensis]
MNKKSIKLELASKIFEIRGFAKKEKEDFYMNRFWEKMPDIQEEFEFEYNDKDPPDYIIKSKLNNDIISCELTEIHNDKSKKGSASQKRIGGYEALLKKLKLELNKSGLSHLYGVFHLKENIKKEFELSKILEKDKPEQIEFISALISMLGSIQITSNLDIKYNVFNENSLVNKYLEYFTCCDMSSYTSEREFYWWFSHLKSGHNECNEIKPDDIQQIILGKADKLKEYEKKYSKHWLIIYSADLSLRDSYILRDISELELQLYKGCGFDRVYYLSSWFKPALLCQGNLLKNG